MLDDWLEAALAEAMGFAEVQEIAAFIRSLATRDEMHDALINMFGDEKADVAASLADQLVAERDGPVVAVVTMGPIINCTGCGKIEVDGRDDCSFCGKALEYTEDPRDAPDVVAAREHRDRLLALDATQSQRTTVIDANAHFDADKRSREARTGAAVVDIDLVNRTILRRAPMSDESAAMVEGT
ncbi:hypothetical protein SPRG_05545 [Saprolegnia parasitica CBS 223.65]|uniref:Uncharacterized protein n=1 Tax=Saprolegnia parasitica (strain CBS 223.65) TaxID=695850 RepID=A0A067CS18_SAPPC|nr:hypothetical protein SPRG_05545 [Saprolegnia parasitica CBS 223.65]KDO29592.1 hypothetical protein SPRG_05545 [Saprolegnia parasitica CBS 223.65]|eukprot:XP_012199653.1 hypothetical protein SPRG_05545 [Saprolegnia parasitica CBS 223.65]